MHLNSFSLPYPASLSPSPLCELPGACCSMFPACLCCVPPPWSPFSLTWGASALLSSLSYPSLHLDKHLCSYASLRRCQGLQITQVYQKVPHSVSNAACLSVDLGASLGGEAMERKLSRISGQLPACRSHVWTLDSGASVCGQL